MSLVIKQISICFIECRPKQISFRVVSYCSITITLTRSSTRSCYINIAFNAAKKLQVGGVMINDSSMYRADAMPYGGVKQSGIGREGPRYAIEEMTDLKIIVLNT